MKYQNDFEENKRRTLEEKTGDTIVEIKVYDCVARWNDAEPNDYTVKLSYDEERFGADMIELDKNKFRASQTKTLAKLFELLRDI